MTAFIQTTRYAKGISMVGGGVLIRTDHNASKGQVGQGQAFSLTSSSFTPSNNSLIVMTVGIEGFGPNGGPVGDTTVTNSGTALTWTRRIVTTPVVFDGGPNGDYWGNLEIWTAPVTTGASMTVTWTHADGVPVGGDISCVQLHIMSYTGYNTGSPIGASVTDITNGDAGLTITLSGSPASNSEVIACRMRLDLGTVATGATPDATWSERFDTSSDSTGYLDHETMSRTGSTSTSVIWTDTSTNASASSIARHTAALEIKAA